MGAADGRKSHRLEFATIDCIAGRDVERLHVSAAKTNPSQLMSGDRQNGSNASIAIEDLHSHARGGVGISIAIHADLGYAAIVGGIGNVEPVIGLANCNSPLGCTR